VNPEVFQFGIIGRRWLHLDSPRHIMLIPTKLLIHKLESLGMKVEMITMTDEGTIACNTGGWRFFFHHTCVRPYTNRTLRFISFNVMNLIGKAVSFLPRPIDQSDGMGSAYTVVFRKAVESNSSCSEKTTPTSDHVAKAKAA